MDKLLKLNFFELFSIEPVFNINLEQIQNNMRELQKQYHPDKYSNQAIEVANQSLILSSYINEAYRTLASPLLRALYLLKLRGVEIDLVHETKFSHAFLLEQIEVREAIDDARDNQDFDQLLAIENELQAKEQKLVQQVNELFTSDKLELIIEPIKQLSFYVKLQQLVASSIAEI
ncbi:MAG: Fe-S protein assembly co-chaperone HscB [Neisseriales bacterium]|nr:MAG: Fe-S protein assembly co-chaperone HscB [Neisseriales bacterium]